MTKTKRTFCSGMGLALLASVWASRVEAQEVGEEALRAETPVDAARRFLEILQKRQFLSSAVPGMVLASDWQWFSSPEQLSGAVREGFLLVRSFELGAEEVSGDVAQFEVEWDATVDEAELTGEARSELPEATRRAALLDRVLEARRHRLWVVRQSDGSWRAAWFDVETRRSGPEGAVQTFLDALESGDEAAALACVEVFHFPLELGPQGSSSQVAAWCLAQSLRASGARIVNSTVDDPRHEAEVRVRWRTRLDRRALAESLNAWEIETFGPGMREPEELARIQEGSLETAGSVERWLRSGSEVVFVLREIEPSLSLWSLVAIR